MDRQGSDSAKVDMNELESTTLDNVSSTDSGSYNKRTSSGTTKHASFNNDLDDVPYQSLSTDEENAQNATKKSATDAQKKIHREQSNELLSRDNIQTRKNHQFDKNRTDQESRTRRRGEDADDAPGRLPTPRISPATSTVYRPESRPGSGNKKTSLSGRYTPSFSSTGASQRPSSSRRLGRHNLKAHQLTNGDEEDEDISLEGLSELLGTVRQYAQEIREIYAPIKKDEEERIRRKDERNSRRKSKENNNGLTLKSDRNMVLPGHQEVRVEIHKTDDQMSQHFVEEGRRSSRHETSSFSKSHDSSASKETTSLHVEEENLAKTWPRGQSNPRSRERFWADISRNNQQPYSTSPSSLVTRSKTPSDWNEASSIQHEREMLTKAFQRIHKPNNDPLLGISSKGRSRSHIQEQLMTSRQSVIEVARQHTQSRHVALPSISIISPAREYRNKSWNSPGGILPSAPPEDDYSVNAFIPTSPFLEEPECHSKNISKTRVISEEITPSLQSRDRSTDEESSARRGPLVGDHNPYANVLEKY